LPLVSIEFGMFRPGGNRERRIWTRSSIAMSVALHAISHHIADVGMVDFPARRRVHRSAPSNRNDVAGPGPAPRGAA